MAYEKEIIITANTKGATEGLKDVDKSLKKVSGTATNTNSELSEVSKGALDSAKNFKVMGVSLNDVSKGLRLFKVSLIATGIGAIVVIVGSLAAAFLSTQEGVNKLNSVMMPLKEVMQTMFGIVQKLGKGLFQMVSGDVREGWKSMGKAVENVGDQMEKAWQNGEKLYALQNKIRENNINDGLVISRLNRLRADQLEIAEDINRTVDERRNAYKAAIASEEAITKLKKRQNDLLVEEAERKTRANDTDDEAKRALNDLIAQGEDIESSGIKAKILLQKKLNTVKVEGVKEEQEARKAVKGIDTTLEGSGEEELLQQKLIGDQKIAQNRAIQDQMKLYNDEIRAEDLEAERIKEEQVKEAKFAIANQTMNVIGMLAKKGSKVAKGVAAAQAIMNTYQGITAALAAPSTIPEPFGFALKIANAASVGVMGLLNAKKILSTDETGMSQGGTPSAPSAPAAPSFNLVQGTGSNQIAQGLGQQQRPIQAYVVSNNVTTAQSLDRNIIAGASL